MEYLIMLYYTLHIILLLHHKWKLFQKCWYLYSMNRMANALVFCSIWIYRDVMHRKKDLHLVNRMRRQLRKEKNGTLFILPTPQAFSVRPCNGFSFKKFFCSVLDRKFSRFPPLIPYNLLLKCSHCTNQILFPKLIFKNNAIERLIYFYVLYWFL